MLNAPIDADAGVEDLEHVLVAALLAAGRVGVRDLVDDQLGPARDDRCSVHLFDRDSPVFDARARDSLQPVDQHRGLGAAVRLDEAERDFDAAPLERLRLLQHAIGLADAGGEPDVQLQAPALRATEDLEEILRPLRSRVIARPRCPAPGQPFAALVRPCRPLRARSGRIAFWNDCAPWIAKRNERSP